MSGAQPPAPRILVFGDAFGRLDAFVKRLQSVNEKNGPFDAAFCVGQFFPAVESGVEGVDAYFKGEKTIPVPTYFIGDYGEGANSLLAPARSKALDMGSSMGSIPVCDNLLYLKGNGILNLKGRRIAYLSGKYIADVYKNVWGAEASGGHFEGDVNALRAIADEKDVTDIFLSNEWPRGVTRSSSAPEGIDLTSTGSDISAELASVLKPRYHFAGSEGVFYAREPYINHDATHVTRFIGLGAVGNDIKQKFVHALSPTPASVMSPSDLASKPTNTTLSPYVKRAHSKSTAGTSQKRDVGQMDKCSAKDGQYWRCDTSQGKRQRRTDGGNRAKQIGNIVESADVGDTTRDIALEPKHKVFLSHSGAQKNFVEQLCVDLERCDRYPFFDRRCSSLPIGKNFPKRIFKAIEQCEVGVVVLSEEFFMRSKWPMSELVAMTRNPKLEIIPVYFGVSLEQVRDPKKQKRWLSVWHGWAGKDKRIDIEEWCGVLKALGPLNSLVYDGLGEVSFRERIVQAVCDAVLPESRWNDSHVKGRCRLAKVICEKINEAKVSKKYGMRLVGLHGVGGIGKTTICQILCNEYVRKMQGRVFHMELGSASNLELLQGALKTLTDKSYDVLCRLNMSQCQDMLKREIGKQAIFLAIDNMSDDTESIEQAKIFLSTGFDNGSIVIVTARSLEVLKLCHLDITESNCLEMPELHKGEAKSLFLEHGICDYEARTEVDDEIIDSCLKRCYFQKGDGKSYHYHPLALKVLGIQLGCIKYDRNKWAAMLKEVDTFNRRREKEHPVFSILRKSFDILLPMDQMLFMDVALYLPELEFPGFNMTLFEWLSMVHVTSVHEIMERLEGLKRKSLLQDLGDGCSTKIGMHDLWREFAVVESKVGDFECRRWVYEVGEPSGLEEGSPSRGCWQNMTRMRFMGDGVMSAKRINFGHFSNILVLTLVSDIYLPGGLVLDVNKLKHLKSLELVLRRHGKAKS